MIPKILHQIWIGNTIPDAQKALCMNNEKVIGKNWEYRLWGNEDLNENNFPHTWKYIQKSFAYGKKRGKIWYAQISDLMRYEILYTYGGLYMDAGIQVTKSFDGIIRQANQNNQNLIVCNQEQYCDPLNCGYTHYVRGKSMYKKFISNSFIGSSPKSIYMKRAMSKTKLDAINLNDPQVNFQTGPSYLRSLFKKSKSVLVLPTHYIYPFNWYEAAGANTSLNIKKSADKCISLKKPKQQHLIGSNQLKQMIYLNFPCKKYPKSYAIKHWDLGGSWLKKT